MAEATDAVTARLDALAAAQPALARAAGIYRAVLPLLGAAGRRAVAPAVAAAAAAEGAAALAAGRPVVPARLAAGDRAAAAAFDPAAAGDLAGQIRAALAAAGVVGVGTDPGTAQLVDSFAMRPTWQAWRGAWEPALAEAVAAWQRGYCYLCGALPALAELRGNEGHRYLRCGQCGAAWPYPRLACSACGSQDRGALGVHYPEREHERLRVATCERCHSYIKEIVTFAALPAEMIPVEDLATLELDRAAEAAGYRRVPGG